MKIKLLIMVLVVALTCVNGLAQGRRNNPPAHSGHVEHNRNNVVVLKPKTVHSIKLLPSNHTTATYRGIKYYINNGQHYKYMNNKYVLVTPPNGLRVKSLPKKYTKVSSGKTTYYYFSGVFYKKLNGSREYEVVAPRVGMMVPNLPPMNVAQVKVNGKKYFELDGYLYEPTKNKYKVVSVLNHY